MKKAYWTEKIMGEVLKKAKGDDHENTDCLLQLVWEYKENSKNDS